MNELDDSRVVTMRDLKEHCDKKCTLFNMYIDKLEHFKTVEAAAQVEFLSHVTELTKEFMRNTTELFELKKEIVKLREIIKAHVIRDEYPPETFRGYSG
jgi:hypothetical protein